MSNTLDVLESVGKNAALRFSTTDELMVALAGLDASDAVRHAAATGDMAPLRQAAGPRHVQTLNSPVQTGTEDPPGDTEFWPEEDDGGEFDEDDDKA
ncbi:MAG TPA: hypothetical protein VFN09_14330 [Rhodanobacteraceae bacterium]|nr:hypothetical protein [Rhodanobacteraceae bacterium]